MNMNPLMICEPIFNENNNYEPIFWWPDEKVHIYEPFYIYEPFKKTFVIYECFLARLAPSKLLRPVPVKKCNLRVPSNC